MNISRYMIGGLVGGVLALLVACGAPAEPPARTLDDVPFNLQYGYIDTARQMGATGISDEQLLAAGMYVCSNWGAYTKDTPQIIREGTYNALVNDPFDLIPDTASGATVPAVLASSSFLCLGEATS